MLASYHGIVRNGRIVLRGIQLPEGAEVIVVVRSQLPLEEQEKRLAALMQALMDKNSLLDTAINIEDMDLPGFRLHPLKGDRQGLWAIDVSKNWRITFEFIDGNAYVVNYEDYH